MAIFNRKDAQIAELLQEAERSRSRGQPDRAQQQIREAAQLLVDQNRVDEAIDLLINERDYTRAGDVVFDKLRDWKRAAQLYFRGGDFAKAARARKENNEPLLAAELYERCGDFVNAAAIYEKSEDFVRASSLYEKAGDKQRAADLLVRALSSGTSRRVVGAEADEVCRRAGVLYADIGHIELAVRILRWGTQYVFAGQLLARAGRTDEAIELLTKSGDYLAAAEIARSAGNEKRAQMLLGERAEKEGRYAEAAGHFEIAESFLRAARFYEYAGQIAKAAEVYERSGQMESAAELYEQIGRFADAKRVLKSAGREAEAEKIEDRADHREDSIRQHVAKGEFLRAAEIKVALARTGDRAQYLEAAQLLSFVLPDNATYFAARTLLAEVFAEQGDPRGAINVLQALLAGITVTVEHISAQYHYAWLLEREGYLASARNAYRVIASIDPSYRDVVYRLGQLRESDAAPAPRVPPVRTVTGVPSAPPRSQSESFSISRVPLARHHTPIPVVSVPSPPANVSSIPQAAVSNAVAPIPSAPLSSSPGLAPVSPLVAPAVPRPRMPSRVNTPPPFVPFVNTPTPGVPPVGAKGAFAPGSPLSTGLVAPMAPGIPSAPMTSASISSSGSSVPAASVPGERAPVPRRSSSVVGMIPPPTAPMVVAGPAMASAIADLTLDPMPRSVPIAAPMPASLPAPMPASLPAPMPASLPAPLPVTAPKSPSGTWRLDSSWGDAVKVPAIDPPKAIAESARIEAPKPASEVANVAPASEAAIDAAASEPAPRAPAIEARKLEPASDAAPASEVAPAKPWPASDPSKVEPAIEVAKLEPAIEVAKLEPAIEVAKLEPAIDDGVRASPTPAPTPTPTPSPPSAGASRANANTRSAIELAASDAAREAAARLAASLFDSSILDSSDLDQTPLEGSAPLVAPTLAMPMPSFDATSLDEASRDYDDSQLIDELEPIDLQAANYDADSTMELAAEELPKSPAPAKQTNTFEADTFEPDSRDLPAPTPDLGFLSIPAGETTASPADFSNEPTSETAAAHPDPQARPSDRDDALFTSTTEKFSVSLKPPPSFESESPSTLPPDEPAREEPVVRPPIKLVSEAEAFLRDAGLLDEDDSEPRLSARPSSLQGVVLRGRFRIERRIGKGAQAHVYLARDLVLDRPVAIKVLNEAVARDTAALDRFLREARLAARVHHASCIAIFDFGQERGVTFMAMEYFKGKTLRDRLAAAPLEAIKSLRIAREVAEALGAVHGAGIVHRDVKPTNVMVDDAGNARLTDFGVAKSMNEEATTTGVMVGTMKYMSPEQARGKEADRRSDIFSLGVVLFEMLAGHPPFGGSLDALIRRVTQPPPVLPAEVAVPELVRSVVQKCMQRKPEARYQSVEPMIDDLRRCIDLVSHSNGARRDLDPGESLPIHDDDDLPMEIPLHTSDLQAIDADDNDNPTDLIELP